MKIFMLSSDPVTAEQITQQCSQRASGHRLSVSVGTAQQLQQHGGSLKKTDLLIICSQTVTASDLLCIETVLSEHPQLNCMLVSAPMSTQQLTLAMRAGVCSALSTPLESNALAEELSRLAAKLYQDGAQLGRTVSFVSCKGGSGATFLAANLASVHAATTDEHVLLIDLEQQFSDACLYLSERRPSTTLVDLCAQAERLDNALFDASVMNIHGKFDLLAGAGDPVRAAELQPDVLEQLLTMARQRYDTVVVDVGQSIDQLSMEVLDQSDVFCLVLQPSLAHLYAGKHLVDILLSLGYDRSQMLMLINQFDAKTAPISLETFKDKLGLSRGMTLPLDVKHVEPAVMGAKLLRDISPAGPLAKGIGSLHHLLWPAAAVEASDKLARRGLFNFKSKSV